MRRAVHLVDAPFGKGGIKHRGVQGCRQLKKPAHAFMHVLLAELGPMALHPRVPCSEAQERFGDSDLCGPVRQQSFGRAGLAAVYATPTDQFNQSFLRSERRSAEFLEAKTQVPANLHDE